MNKDINMMILNLNTNIVSNKSSNKYLLAPYVHQENNGCLHHAVKPLSMIVPFDNSMQLGDQIEFIWQGTKLNGDALFASVTTIVNGTDTEYGSNEKDILVPLRGGNVKIFYLLNNADGSVVFMSEIKMLLVL